MEMRDGEADLKHAETTKWGGGELRAIASHWIHRCLAAEKALRAIMRELNDSTICGAERWCNIEERVKQALSPTT